MQGVWAATLLDVISSMPMSKPLYLDDTAGPKRPRPKRFRQRVPYPIAELPAELKGPDHTGFTHEAY